MDSQTLATLVAVGGAALLFVVPRMLGGSKDEGEDEKAAQTNPAGENESKKKKKKSKNSATGKKEALAKKKKEEAAEKKRLAAEKKKRAEEEKAAKAKAEKEARIKAEKEAKIKAEKEAKEKAAREAAQAKKKKKNKNKKNKQPEVDAGKEAEEAVAAAAAAARLAAAAAQFENAGDDWETVPIKKKKKKKVVVDSGVTDVDASGKATAEIEIGEFGSNIIGPGGSRITQIQSSSGASVNIDKGSSLCTITGTPEQVDAAKEMVINIIGSQGKEVIDLGAKRSLVFGAGGERIRKIQQESGARLDLDKGSSVCNISGNAEAVQVARAMIQGILNDSNIDSIVLGEKELPAVIGKGGENVRRIQAESGAVVDIDGDSNVCTITGSAEQVSKAAQLIRLYVEHRGPPPEAVETITVSQEHGRLLIGKKGATVQNLQNQTGTRISISLEVSGAVVTVSGGKQQVVDGVQTIYKLIADNSHTDTIALSDAKLVPAILGTKGETINKIRNTTDARVEIAVDNSGVVITGTKSQVAKARDMITAKIAAELGPPPVKAGEIQKHVDLGSATGKIIGAAGSNIARLEKEHGAQVTVKNGTMCYITGPEGSVLKVKKEIDDVLERHRENLERAKKEAEKLRELQIQQDQSNGGMPGANDVVSGGWDVPELSSWTATSDPWAAPSNSSTW
uniref:K Homology domain-containing protein n=1 Tax=Mucochytrium quahogii TaxID=96639 RepID=A0A7S2RUY5_9STRA|mmetsp:Transcript_20485/g.44567  ORF Transcript_20485/g.44567 Transcript_20485/m.44567 type:complete len:680 (+) Transcript_20485:46-2085(+)